MDKIFLTVLNMTFTANFVITAIIIARLFLKKTPKIISYVLWIAAGFRLVFPFSIESALSLIPFKPHPIPQDIVEQAVPRIDTGITAIDNTISSILPVSSSYTSTNVNILQILITAGSISWIFGIAAMLIYSSVSMITLKRRLNDAVLLKDNIYEAKVKTPFVTGFFRPKIYIPVNLADSERGYIILHERNHIKRRDNFIKLFAYLILSLHWFNPLVWAAFILMSMDMEMSCDENVLKESGAKTKKAYSMSILSLATERHTINIYPLAFGEGDTKRRIKNVLNFKKYSKIRIIATLIVVVALTVGLMVNNTISAENSQENNDFQYAAEFLTKLQIMSENDISTDNATLKDVAFFIAKIYHPNQLDLFYGRESEPTVINALFGLSGSVYLTDFDNKFFDDAIADCIKNGIMDSDWFSDPDATVTLRDAVKMFVTALKYEGIADGEYIKKATTKEVRLLGKYAVFPFTGVSADKILTKNDIIMLVYNFIMSEYAVDIEGTIDVLRYDIEHILEINPNITIDDIAPGTTYREKQPTTFRSVINTFGVYVATPISSKVTVDGKEISFDAYNIDGSNYFKLRDIAYVLNGTPKQFSIEDGNLMMNLTIGAPYTYSSPIKSIATVDGSLGYEMAEKGTNTVTAFKQGPNEFIIWYASDRDRVEKFGIETYEINGSFYYKLRDMAEALDFSLNYDSIKNIIAIETSKPYPNRTPIVKDYYPQYPSE